MNVYDHFHNSLEYLLELKEILSEGKKFFKNILKVRKKNPILTFEFRTNFLKRFDDSKHKLLNFINIISCKKDEFFNYNIFDYDQTISIISPDRNCFGLNFDSKIKYVDYNFSYTLEKQIDKYFYNISKNISIREYFSISSIVKEIKEIDGNGPNFLKTFSGIFKNENDMGCIVFENNIIKIYYSCKLEGKCYPSNTHWRNFIKFLEKNNYRKDLFYKGRL
jgi:hypothetical protein